MAKTKISEYDSTAANNTDIDSINIAEGMAPSNVNNAIRELMAHLKDGLGAGTPVFLDQTNTRLGVGTTSPFTTLEIESAGESLAGLTSHMEISHNSLSANTGGALVLSSNNNRHGAIKGGSDSGGGTGYLSFHTRPSSGDLDEAMRIDSSGNLLVGTTNVNLYNTSSDTGIALRDNEPSAISRDGGVPIYINRLTSDGGLMYFQRNGSTVGAIGTTSTDQLFISRSSGSQGIKFKNSGAIPCNSDGTDSDDDQDLGLATIRWKDLYLSGGIRLGGTTSANLLEDYEEGNWVPTAFGSTTGSGTQITLLDTSTAGYYTKIGRQVTVVAEIDVSATNSASGTFTVGSLPFNIANLVQPTSIESNGSVAFWSGFSTSVNSVNITAQGGTSTAMLRGLDADRATSGDSLTVADVGTGEFRFTLTYFTS